MAHKRARVWTRKLLAAWFFGSALLMPSSAQNSEGAIPTLRVSTQLVVLDASLQRKKIGQPLGNLTPADFVLQEDGVPQTISSLSQDRLPLSIVLLFDLTESVRPIFKPLAAGAREVLAHLKPEDEVAVMGFSSRTTLLQDFTTDRSLAAAAISLASVMTDEDGTFIHEDMWQAIDQAGKSRVPGSRRLLVWLTDGSANSQDNFSREGIGKRAPAYLHSEHEATDKLVHSGVVTSALIERSAAGDATIGLGFLIGAHMGDINHYADLTGGPVLQTTRADVAAKLGELIDELRQRETLSYKPLQAKPAGTYCKVTLQLSAGFFARHPEIHKKDVVIRTANGYYR